MGEEDWKADSVEGSLMRDAISRLSASSAFPSAERLGWSLESVEMRSRREEEWEERNESASSYAGRMPGLSSGCQVEVEELDEDEDEEAEQRAEWVRARVWARSSERHAVREADVAMLLTVGGGDDSNDGDVEDEAQQKKSVAARKKPIDPFFFLSFQPHETTRTILQLSTRLKM